MTCPFQGRDFFGESHSAVVARFTFFNVLPRDILDLLAVGSFTVMATVTLQPLVRPMRQVSRFGHFFRINRGLDDDKIWTPVVPVALAVFGENYMCCAADKE